MAGLYQIKPNTSKIPVDAEFKMPALLKKHIKQQKNHIFFKRHICTKSTYFAHAQKKAVQVSVVIIN